MQKIDVRGMGPHEWAVVVTEGEDTTSHRVTVSDELIDNLGIIDLDEERLVRESFEFLLEREPADAIRREFDLDVVSRYFPDYGGEIRARLGV
jgi:hypothetical protein